MFCHRYYLSSGTLTGTLARTMIPRNVTLQNFLSYGNTPQTISFDSYNLICLSGKNGHGKSALLDAITWVVWGQARKTVGTNKPDDGLLRLGARQMVVIFECDVNGQQYRIRREYSKGQGKAQANLDIGVYDPELDDYRSLTEKTIRRTQAVIEEVVGLDYETYTNSAFLRQGQANEFSQKSPKERKKILATILGVNRFDGLQSFALEKGRECNQQIQILQGLQAQDEQVLATYDELVVQRKEHEKSQSEITKTLTQLATEQQHAQQALEQYLARKKDYAERIAEVEHEWKKSNERRAQWGQRAHEWRVQMRLLHDAAGQQAGAQELTELRKKEHALRAAQRAVLTAQQQHMALEKKCMDRRRELEQGQQKEREALVKNVHDMQAQLDQTQTKKEHAIRQLTQIQAEHAQLVEQDVALAKQVVDQQKVVMQHEHAKKQFDKRRAFYAAYVPRAKWLYQQQQELEQKGALVLEDGRPSCPLCEQMISAQRKKFIHDKLHNQSSLVRHQYARLHTVLGRLKERLVTDHETVKVYDAARAQLQTLQGQREVMTKRTLELRANEKELVKECTAIEKAYAAVEKECAAAKEAVSKREQGMQEQLLRDEQLVLWGQELQILKAADHTYDEKVHAAVEQRIAVLEKQQADFESLREKSGALREQRVTLSTERIRLKEERRELVAKKTKLAAGGLDAEQEAVLQKVASDVRMQHAEAQAAKERIVAQLSTVATKLEQVAKCREAFEKRTKEIAALEERKSDYTVLATAWSKNGIQALLIEQAIPEIEQEANELLGRLSQNQAQVFIESQRDLKSGGVRETLDIKISDSMGVRPYEMFSGGEAFRIDFALRIAISKLLARRAGTALQVLIIDEGFGSQDEEGLQRLMQALYTVQEDFEKIIIVSHLPEFKENFPVHFVVQKGATGSQVTVEQRG